MNELTKKDETPSYLTTASGRTGFEDIGADDVKMAFMKLAQLNTPEAQPGTKAITGLKPGEFFNNASRKSYGTEPSVIIVGYKRSFTEWQGEGAEAKLVAQYTPAQFAGIEAACKVDEKGRLFYNGNRINDSRNFLLLSAEHPEDGVFQYSATSTAIGAARKWLTLASCYKSAPIYARVWKLSATWTESPSGNYFKLDPPSDLGWTPSALADIAKAAFERGAAIAEAKPEDESVPF